MRGSPHIEGYHGVAQGGPSNWGRRNPTPTTQFPQAYGLGSTWNPELVRKVAAQQAQEARYLFQSAKYDRSCLIVRAPQADLARDPRYWKTAALAKHFLANSNEDGRESSSWNFDERLWREYYAKPFEMAVREVAPNGTPGSRSPGTSSSWSARRRPIPTSSCGRRSRSRLSRPPGAKRLARSSPGPRQRALPSRSACG